MPIRTAPGPLRRSPGMARQFREAQPPERTLPPTCGQRCPRSSPVVADFPPGSPGLPAHTTTSLDVPVDQPLLHPLACSSPPFLTTLQLGRPCLHHPSCLLCTEPVSPNRQREQVHHSNAKARRELISSALGPKSLPGQWNPTRAPNKEVWRLIYRQFFVSVTGVAGVT